MIYTTQRRRFVYDTWDNESRLGRVMVECTLFMTHCLRLNLQLHTISLVRTCRISSFGTVAWQLARLLLTRRIARSLGDSGASCCTVYRRLVLNTCANFFLQKVAILTKIDNPIFRLWETKPNGPSAHFHAIAFTDVMLSCVVEVEFWNWKLIPLEIVRKQNCYYTLHYTHLTASFPGQPG